MLDKIIEKELTVEDLKPGDILAFDGVRKNKDGSIDYLTVLIQTLTRSKITHGALYMGGDPFPKLADAGAEGIHTHKISDASGESSSRTVHVCRLKENSSSKRNPEEMERVLEIAMDYVKQDLKYPNIDLVLLGMILIYKNHSSLGLKQSVVIDILMLITAKIKTATESKLFDGKHTMVCSSYVYQCYLDASKEYPDLKLVIENGDVFSTPSRLPSRATTLFDMYREYAAGCNYKTQCLKIPQKRIPQKRLNELLREAVKNCKGGRKKGHVFLTKNDTLCAVIENFLKMLMKFFGVEIRSVEDLIANAQKQQAMFVTPNDLYCHIANVDQLGVVHMHRNGDIVE